MDEKELNKQIWDRLITNYKKDLWICLIGIVSGVGLVVLGTIDSVLYLIIGIGVLAISVLHAAWATEQAEKEIKDE